MGKLTFFDRFFRFRAANHIIREISPYIRPNSKVLDIGAGSGIAAEQIAKKLKIDITLVDVVDKEKSICP